MRVSAFLLILAIVVRFAAPAAGQPTDTPTDQLGLDDIVHRVSDVTSITHAGDDRLFVTERAGTIAVVRDDRRLDGFFLDIRDRVGAAGQEQGLLGLAFHPRYAETGWFFVDYTDRAGDTVISRFRVSGDDPNRAPAESEAVLLRIPQPFSNHNGGQLAFGPDGHLYVGTGDGGAAFDPPCNAQDLGSLLGKILRLDVDVGAGAPPYHSVPADNPFVGVPGARPEIWAYGLRNPWRFSFDRLTGELYVGDVGQNAVEEIDRQPPGRGGLNYGWKVMEGPVCTGRTDGCSFAPPPCDAAAFTPPLVSYEHQQGRCSVTGGYVYRGSDIAGLEGSYLYGDFCTGEVWVLYQEGNQRRVEKMRQTVPLLTTFGEGADGELYLGTSAAVWRLTGPAAPAEPCVADEHTLCLHGDGRFRVRATFRVGQGPSRVAGAEGLTSDTGYFWFFDEDNVEVVVKVLDSCAVSARFWVFASGLTNVEVEITVFDSLTGQQKTYRNPFRTQFAPIQDTSAFATCQP